MSVSFGTILKNQAVDLSPVRFPVIWVYRVISSVMPGIIDHSDICSHKSISPRQKPDKQAGVPC